MIIINSDDFGASKEINLATYRAFQDGLISSASTLVNFRDGLDDAVGYVKSGKIDENAIGIHLNLSEGIPITERARNNDTLCNEGLFKGLDAIPRFIMDSDTKKCVYEELDAQINLFKEKFGFLPSHIDSHQHVHTRWAIFSSVGRLAKEHKINAVRISRTLNRPKDYKIKFYKFLFNSFLRLNGFKVTDDFGDLDEAFYVGIKPNKKYEVMVHSKLSTDGFEIVDLDDIPLKLKLRKLKRGKELPLVNYKIFTSEI